MYVSLFYSRGASTFSLRTQKCQNQSLVAVWCRMQQCFMTSSSFKETHGYFSFSCAQKHLSIKSNQIYSKVKYYNNCVNVLNNKCVPVIIDGAAIAQYAIHLFKSLCIWSRKPWTHFGPLFKTQVVCGVVKRLWHKLSEGIRANDPFDPHLCSAFICDYFIGHVTLS